MISDHKCYHCGSQINVEKDFKYNKYLCDNCRNIPVEETESEKK
jgi:hypothetical protein